MTISAQRMQFLDQETNLGLANLVAIDTPDVYNAAINQIDEVTAELDGFISSAEQSIVPVADQLKSTADSALRATRDAFSSISDMTGMAESKIQSMIAGMLPKNPLMQNAFSNISKNCRNNALARSNSGFKPLRDKINCGGKSSSMRNGKCQAGEISGLLGGISGLVGQVAGALAGMLKKLITLAGMGYDIGLCGIFGGLSAGMPGNIIQRGAASLLATTGLAGNTKAVLDIAGNMGNSRPALEIPGLVGMAMDNFTIPDGYSAGDLGELGDGYMTAMQEIDPDWDANYLDGLDKAPIPDYSAVSLGQAASPDMVRTSQAMAGADGFYDAPSLQMTEVGEHDVFCSAMSSDPGYDPLDDYL